MRECERSIFFNKLIWLDVCLIGALFFSDDVSYPYLESKWLFIHYYFILTVLSELNCC